MALASPLSVTYHEAARGMKQPLTPKMALTLTAFTTLQVMMYAQLRDNNQGIIKITTGGMNRAPGAGPIAIERNSRLSAIINGNGDAGMLVLSKAREMAAAKCLEHGFGIVGTNNTYTSTGCLAYYAEKLAEQGLIGVVLAQSPEFVAPAGVTQNVPAVVNRA